MAVPPVPDCPPVPDWQAPSPATGSLATGGTIRPERRWSGLNGGANRRRTHSGGMDWLQQLIGPDQGDATWWQLSVRAVILFAVGILYIRLAGRRAFSQATPFDIVVSVIVGSNLSRAMTGKAPFLAS